MKIHANNLLKIADADVKLYKLHLAGWNGSEQPLDVFSGGWNDWMNWNEWRGNKNDFNRDYIFSLIRFYSEPDKWLFGGIFKVVERFQDFAATKKGYRLEVMDLHKEMIGRLMIDFHRYQGMRGRSFKLENYYSEFVVSEILRKPYGSEFEL
jgi:hypothetical protein